MLDFSSFIIFLIMCIRIDSFAFFVPSSIMPSNGDKFRLSLFRDNWGYRGGPGEKSHVIPVTDDSGIRDPTYAYLTKLPEEQTNFTAHSGLLCSTSYD